MDGISPDPSADPRTEGEPASGLHLRRRLAAEPRSVGEARLAIRALLEGADIDEARRSAVALAVSEAVSNAVLHAYRDAGGVVDLFAIRVGGELIVTVSDRGRGLGHPSERPGLGVGLRLIRECSDQALIASREGGGATVQCRFRLAGQAAPQTDSASA